MDNNNYFVIELHSRGKAKEHLSESFKYPTFAVAISAFDLFTKDVANKDINVKLYKVTKDNVEFLKCNYLELVD